MALRVVQAPGCRDIYSDSDLGVSAGDIVIDTGAIAAALGYDPLSPDREHGLAPCGVSAERPGDQGRGRGRARRCCQNVEPERRPTVVGSDGRLEGGDPLDIALRGVPSHQKALTEQPGPGGDVRVGP